METMQIISYFAWAYIITIIIIIILYVILPTNDEDEALIGVSKKINAQKGKFSNNITVIEFIAVFLFALSFMFI